MEFLSVKELSAKLNFSEKTIYNYINKHSKEIRSRKEFWKTLASLEDFTKLLQKRYKAFNTSSSSEPEIQLETDYWKESESDSKFQNEFEMIRWENEELKSNNQQLKFQIAHYVKLHDDEQKQNEKLFGQLQDLQNQYTDKIESFWKEKLRRIRKYYMMLSLWMILLVLLVVSQIPIFITVLW